MAIPSADCFPGLDLRDQVTAIYEALLELSDVEPVTAECFRGEDQLDQITHIYEVILGIPGSGEDLPTTDCFKWYDRDQQLGYIYTALFNIAGDPELLDPECFGGYDLREQLSYIYDALRVLSGSGDLPTRECFLSGDWQQMLAGLFDATVDAEVSGAVVMDWVQNFSNGSGTLTAAKLELGNHGEDWGDWSEPEPQDGHTTIVDHAVTMPFGMLAGGIEYTGAEGQGVTFDFATQPLGADVFQLGFIEVVSACQLMFLARYETVLDGVSPVSYNCDLFVIAGADFTVPQRQQTFANVKFLTAHTNGDLGAGVTDSGTWLLVSIYHDVPNERALMLVQEVVQDGSEWVLGNLLGTSTSLHAGPSGDVTFVRFQDYLRPASGTGSIKVKIFGMRDSVLSWPMYNPGTIPEPTSVLAAQNAPGAVTLTWASVCDTFKIERRVGVGAYSTLETEYTNHGTDSYTDSTVIDGVTYTYRITTIVGSRSSSAVTSNAITVDNDFTPAAGNVLWLKADTIGQADNTPVITWNDSSGLGNHVTQAVAGSRPTYQTNVVNGMPVVRGDGGDFLAHAGVVTANEQHTVMIVQQKSGTNSTIQFYNGNAAADGWGPFQDGSGNRGQLFGGGVAKVDGAFSVNFEILTLTWNGSISQIWVDGVEGILTDTSLPPAGPPTGSTTVLAGTGGANAWNGDVAEILVWDNVISAPSRNEAEAYLAFKYGITI